MKLTPEVEKVLDATFAGDELAEVKELWSKKKGMQSYIKDGALTCSKAELVAKLSKKAAPKASAKVDLSKLSVAELREVIAEAETLIKAKKDSEIAKLKKQIEALEAL